MFLLYILVRGPGRVHHDCRLACHLEMKKLPSIAYVFIIILANRKLCLWGTVSWWYETKQNLSHCQRGSDRKYDWGLNLCNLSHKFDQYNLIQIVFKSHKSHRNFPRWWKSLRRIGIIFLAYATGWTQMLRRLQLYVTRCFLSKTYSAVV